jgi:predicted dehydrogenase
MTRASGITRRDILKRSATTTIAAAGVAALAGVGSNFAFAQGSDKLRIGLVGCGGRGTGAAQDSLSSNDNVELVAMGDLFPDRLESSRQRLREKLADKVKVSDDHCHTGFDAYHKVIDSPVDLVIFATPPAFRPIHIAAAVEAGKHVFAEMPIATDPAGIRSVMESARKIKEKRLGFVCGTQRRHDVGYNEIIKRIHDGAIGELVSGNCYWNQGYLWMHPRQPSWSDMEWQVRNWLYFTWLSGDHICEQHVHNIDVMNWCFDAHPVSAYGMGGRQVRTDPAYGDIFDHFAIEFTYPNGARITSQCRQIDGTDGRVKEHIVGTMGTSDPSGSISGSSKFRYTRPAGALGPYQQEHRDLIDSIRKGQPLNEAQRIAESTLTAIMGRMSAYTGKEVTWEQALNSKLSLLPEKFELGKLPVAPVAEPGKTPLV